MTQLVAPCTISEMVSNPRLPQIGTLNGLSKVFLSIEEDGRVKIVSLSGLQRLARFFFGAYSETHSSKVFTTEVYSRISECLLADSHGTDKFRAQFGKSNLGKVIKALRDENSEIDRKLCSLKAKRCLHEPEVTENLEKKYLAGILEGKPWLEDHQSFSNALNELNRRKANFVKLTQEITLLDSIKTQNQKELYRLQPELKLIQQ